jgi:hypothetical protein
LYRSVRRIDFPISTCKKQSSPDLPDPPRASQKEASSAREKAYDCS